MNQSPLSSVFVVIRCWLPWDIRRQKVISRSCSCVWHTLLRTRVFGPALILPPWRRSNKSWEKSWERWVFVSQQNKRRIYIYSVISLICGVAPEWQLRSVVFIKDIEYKYIEETESLKMLFLFCSSRCTAHQQRRSPCRFFHIHKFQMCCSFLSMARGMSAMLEQRQTMWNCSVGPTTGLVFPKDKPMLNLLEWALWTQRLNVTADLFCGSSAAYLFECF